MFKNIISIFAGYALWTAIFLGGASLVQAARPEVHDENNFTTDVTTLAIYLMISIIASFAGGFLTAKLATRRMVCAGILAACLLGTGIPVQLSAWNDLPVWYNLAFLILLVPVTLFAASLIKTNEQD